MKKYPVVFLCTLPVLAAVFGFYSWSQSYSDVEIARDSIALTIRPVTSPYIPAEVEFAGEPMPLDFFEVRESLERELIVNMNFHSSTLQFLKKMTRFFPVIEPLLAANGIPDDFKYLAMIESDLMNKVSPSGATGFWQFMKDAASDYGLEMNAEVDERYHVEKSTVAACRYFNDAYRVFGNWTLVAASYNMGRTGLTSQMKRQQCNYYYDLLLNEETMRYVYRIAAVKLILTSPEMYGFHVADSERYQAVPCTEVEVNSAVADWADWAFSHQTNYKLLKYLNPWLRDSKLTNAARKTYMIKVPAKDFRNAMQHRTVVK